MSFLVSTLAVAMAAVSPAGGFPAQDVTVAESFQAADGQATHRAVTFDDKAVPPGARILVTEHADDGGTEVELKVEGLQPNRTFGAHVHQKACGSAAPDSGPHYQDKADPKQPSTDPAYANDDNEVWLDFTTDGSGEGDSDATVDWRFRPDGARSVVLHDHATETGQGKAGTAGDRLACVNVPFE
ncbi:superoxide dismutase family protein [Streptomyces bambusae]|uniref:Superoxide dismutase family protein n=1 Tax=Streptomyces bambusae TaxID=1550616 RepID=A0ABS6Z477_9ACTN|nr:superoxide dismutase family protein [Streptomyces bambusae]MBW5482576.1 superoxide dismutase family protein [Streptomyces bambusae]